MQIRLKANRNHAQVKEKGDQEGKLRFSRYPIGLTLARGQSDFRTRDFRRPKATAEWFLKTRPVTSA